VALIKISGIILFKFLVVKSLGFRGNMSLEGVHCALSISRSSGLVRNAASIVVK
jgi:hypothetical protein